MAVPARANEGIVPPYFVKEIPRGPKVGWDASVAAVHISLLCSAGLLLYFTHTASLFDAS